MENETVENEQLSNRDDLVFLMLLVGEVAGQIGGPEFFVASDIDPEGRGVILTMASREYQDIGIQALVKPMLGVEIRRLAITLAFDIYSKIAIQEAANESPGLIVPEKKLIIP